MSNKNELAIYDCEVFDNVNFQERKELLILKAFITWITLRFSESQGRKFTGNELKYLQYIKALEQIKKFAFLSEDDAKIIELNVPLYSAVACSFMKEFLSPDLYESYGNVLIAVDLKRKLGEIALWPPSSIVGKFSEVAPCAMYIADKQEIVKMYKEADSLVRKNNIDIIPLLCMMIPNMLEPKYNKLITELYNKFKDDAAILSAKKRIKDRIDAAEENFRKVLKAIETQGSRVNLAKLAIVLFTVVQSTYTSAPHLISKIKFEKNGSRTPILEFTQTFRIGAIDDLSPIKPILEPLIVNDIKIKIHDDLIMFTTGSSSPANPEDLANCVIAELPDEATLNHMFKNHIGPVVAIDDVDKIMNRVLFEKYMHTHFE